VREERPSRPPLVVVISPRSAPRITAGVPSIQRMEPPRGPGVGRSGSTPAPGRAKRAPGERACEDPQSFNPCQG
jgi:hypothetical protein